MTDRYQKTSLLLGAVASLVVMLASTPDSQAGKLKRRQLQALHQQLAQLQKLAQGELEQAMEAVASWLSDFHQAHGYFPRDHEDAAMTYRKLIKLVPANPYHRQSLQGSALNDPTGIEIKLDYNLSQTTLKSLVEQIREQEKAPPGTITIVSNGADLAVIWGSGADFRVLRDEQGKPEIIALKAQD